MGRVNDEGPFKKSQMRITTLNKEARNFCLQKHLLFLARDNHDWDYQKVRLCSKKMATNCEITNFFLVQQIPQFFSGNIFFPS